MAKLISGGYSGFERHALTHGLMSDSTFRRMADRAKDSISRASGRAREYLQRAYEDITTLDLGKIRDKINSVTKRRNDRYDEDIVCELTSLLELTQAKPSNRRLLMASPRLYSLYEQGLIAGYHGQFEDDESGRIGRDRVQYREIMSGRYVESENDEDTGFITYLSDDLVDFGYDELSINEKYSVRANIERAEDIVDRGEEDPTNQLGGTI